MSKQHRPTYVREDGTEMFVFPKGFFEGVAADTKASGEKPSKALLAMEKELPLEFTREEFEYLWRRLEMMILIESTPEERREMLRDMSLDGA
jgi:hypothetical protein